MLVALAITLIMMGAVVTLFGVISESVASSRSAIEMADRLRAARNTIQSDLQGATATMSPPLRPENAEGYLEIIEGQYSDKNAGLGEDGHSVRTTDDCCCSATRDDMLMFTTRGMPPYTVVRQQSTVESQVAEVIATSSS